MPFYNNAAQGGAEFPDHGGGGLAGATQHYRRSSLTDRLPSQAEYGLPQSPVTERAPLGGGSSSDWGGMDSFNGSQSGPMSIGRRPSKAMEGLNALGSYSPRSMGRPQPINGGGNSSKEYEMGELSGAPQASNRYEAMGISPPSEFEFGMPTGARFGRRVSKDEASIRGRMPIGNINSNSEGFESEGYGSEGYKGEGYKGIGNGMVGELSQPHFSQPGGPTGYLPPGEQPTQYGRRSGRPSIGHNYSDL